MTIDIGKAFSYPTEDEGWMTKVGIGSGLSLLSFLLIPIVFVMGYAIKAIRVRAAGVEGEKLPAWDDWGGLAMKGFLFWLVSLAYGLVPAALFAFGFGSLILGLIGAGGSESSAWTARLRTRQRSTA